MSSKGPHHPLPCSVQTDAVESHRQATSGALAIWSIELRELWAPLGIGLCEGASEEWESGTDTMQPTLRRLAHGETWYEGCRCTPKRREGNCVAMGRHRSDGTLSAHGDDNAQGRRPDYMEDLGSAEKDQLFTFETPFRTRVGS